MRRVATRKMFAAYYFTFCNRHRVGLPLTPIYHKALAYVCRGLRVAEDGFLMPNAIRCGAPLRDGS